MKVPRLLVFSALTVAWASPTPSEAADPFGRSDDWSFIVAPYGWLLGVEGDADYRGIDAEIDQDFSDILSKLDVVIEARLEARKSDWTFFVDPTIALLSDEAEVGPLDVDVDSTLALVGFGISRTLYVGPRLPGSPRRLKLEAGLGGVLVRADSEIDLPGPLPDPELEETWVDAAVSLRATTELGDRWRWHLSGLVGGFGIGESSELSLGGDMLFGRSLGGSKTLWIGYRVLSIDFERGSGARKRDLDVLMHGPVVGMSFGF